MVKPLNIMISFINGYTGFRL